VSQVFSTSSDVKVVSITSGLQDCRRRSAAKGLSWVKSDQLQSVIDALASATPQRMVNPRGQTLLTKREDDVVNLVVDGLSNRETAQKLGLTEHTVSNYLFRIYEKLGISTRVELVLYALRQKQQG
jgi:DNA-binding NarL/FixJ family response regulator